MKLHRELLINKLKEDPLIIYSKFKKYASKLYRQNYYNFASKVSAIKNIYFKFKNNDKILFEF